MPSLTGPVQVFGQELWTSSSTPAHQPGAIGLGPDGRVYRYAKAGADLATGYVLQSPPEGTNRANLNCRATAKGASSILFTNGVTAMTANEFAGGYAGISSDASNSYFYKIAGHAAIAGGAAGALDLDGETVQFALTTSSRIELVAHPYKGVIVHPAAATGACVGVGIFAILNGQYGWIQTGGPANANITGTPAIGQPLTSVGVAGNLSVHTAELNHVAWMMVTGRTGVILPTWWLIN